jgi:hypothetical protein
LRQVSSLASGAGFANIETGFLGLFAAAFEAFELLLGLGRRQQRQRLGVTDRAGKTFGLGQVQFMPRRIELLPQLSR